MFKFVALMLVLMTIFNSILTLSETAEKGENQDGFLAKAETLSVKDDSHNGRFTKKYKEKEKKSSYFDKESRYKQDKNWKRKKNEKQFSSANNFNEFVKPEKFGKYNKHENYLKGPSTNKNVNYHDKTDSYEKSKPYKLVTDESEIASGKRIVSLHRDIAVNYFPHQNSLHTNAEIIDFDKVIENDPSNNALVARYIIHKVDWAALGTLSTNSDMIGAPFVNVISLSDGPINKGSGVPYFYMTPKDFSSMDLERDKRCCITVTLAQTDFCKNKNLDPESPLCARLILYGKIKKVKPGSEEENLARLALFSRHPDMKTWPSDHNWFFSKLDIKEIILISHFGGASYISVQEYFNVTST